MATYDIIALSTAQRELAREARKSLTGRSPYPFSRSSEELYRSLIAAVQLLLTTRKFRKLQERNPNFRDVQKATVSLPKNEPLQNDKWETMVVVQLPRGESAGIVKVLDKIGSSDCQEFIWGPGDACFIPKGWTLMTESENVVIDMWLFLLGDQEA
ncbi:hypothetical protein A9K55_002451 [Cordyceps militaris]|uniref:Uncharacterized protein n=1 Tax=Cordyceps militaris TaxID=73501 RepID=A0A2H4S6T7_CORMI|nr:hypothetical protein A9K55_002451 [Cordyceps militaris]